MNSDRLSLALTPHPSRLPACVNRVTAKVHADGDGWLALRWRIEGAAKLVLPPFAGNTRADDLWRTTCLELFCRKPGEAQYVELNFSPSERWASYDFADYRAGMAPRPMDRRPVITPRGSRDVLLFDVALRLGDLPHLPFEFGVTAVLEEQSGVKSYWALAHGGDAPDFHDPACFAARLAPRGRL